MGRLEIEKRRLSIFEKNGLPSLTNRRRNARFAFRGLLSGNMIQKIHTPYPYNRTKLSAYVDGTGCAHDAIRGAAAAAAPAFSLSTGEERE